CRGSSGYLKSLARHCAVQHPQPLPSIEADPSALQISGQPVHTIAPASSATIAFAHESVYVADAVRFGAVTWTRTNLSLIAALATFALLLNFVFCLVNAAIQSSAAKSFERSSFALYLLEDCNSATTSLIKAQNRRAAFIGSAYQVPTINLGHAWLNL
ncbi:unnamed protein product, partial [Tilletia controversa]